MAEFLLRQYVRVNTGHQPKLGQYSYLLYVCLSLISSFCQKKKKLKKKTQQYKW